MVIGSNKKIKLSSSNTHLTDILSSDIYLELGNIHYNVMKRLLSYEMIRIEEITDFRIQNSGIGKSLVNDEYLRNILPFMFFENVNRKNRSIQLVITYGIMSLKDENNREIFAPIVLIPINLYFENGNIFVQKISRVIENSIIIKKLTNLLTTEQRKVFHIGDKFDNIYSIDKYLFAIDKIEGINVKLENYITIAQLKESDIKIDHSKFPFTKDIEDFLSDRLYDEGYRNFTYLNPLNKRQREALCNAINGKNFAIVGRQGTGKTTTLLNICINAMNQGKRILYVSNMKETLDSVYLAFEDKKLENYVANLSNSFSTLNYGEINIYPKYNINISDNEEKLYQNYKFVKEYERCVHSRILHYRYVEVISELALLSDQTNTILDVDDFSKIYKSEYLEIAKNLKVIENTRQYLDCVKESIWKEIPINNNIDSKKEIIIMIQQLHRCFTILQTEKVVLEKDFGLVDITNLAMLKNIVHDIKRLQIYDVPQSWKEESFAIFNEASLEYKNLKSEIYQLQEKEYYLNYRYTDIWDIDIASEIEIILSKYFTEEDAELIDKINANRNNFLVGINKTSIQKDIFYKCVSKIKKVMGWPFKLDDVIFNELVKLTTYLNNNSYNKKLLEMVLNGSSFRVKNQIKDLEINIKEYHDKLKEFATDFPKADVSKIFEYDSILRNYDDSKESYKKVAPLFYSVSRKNVMLYLPTIKEKVSYIKGVVRKLEKAETEFVNLVGFNSGNTDLIIIQIDALYKYIQSIDTYHAKEKIVSFLYQYTNNETKPNRNANVIVLKTLNLFKKAYLEINKFYDLLIEYNFNFNAKNFIQKINYIKNASIYLHELFDSNDRIYSTIKTIEEDYVKAEVYFSIRDDEYTVKSIKKRLDENDRYRYLFGSMYRSSETNINAISRVIQNFSSYIECFASPKSLIDSLTVETNFNLIFHLDRCLEISNEVNVIFKLYTKVFRDGVTRYYYTDFNQTIDYLKILLNSEDELEYYLIITNNLKTLINLKLGKFINYIINLKGGSNLVNDFKYTYFTNLKNIFISKYPFLNNVKTIESCLDLIVDLENKVNEDNQLLTFNNIRKISGGKFSVNDIRNLDYKSYVRRTYGTKHLFLTTSQILNNFLNISDFDLVIIDDAHLLNANEYTNAMSGKQVIVSGELQLQSSVSSNLISRMRYNSIIELNYRFIPSVKHLMNTTEGLHGIIKNKYSENHGIEIIRDKILEYICLLFRENKNYVINLFISSHTKQRIVYEQLTNIFLSYDFTKEEIFKIFKDNLNISNLLDGYLYHADFNIIYLEDYFVVNVEHIALNMIDNLLLCSNRVIIFDSEDYLNKGNSLFIQLLRKVNVEKELFIGEVNNPVIKKLSYFITEMGIEVLPQHDDLSLILRKQDKLYGVLFFWDYSNSRYDMINDYRDYYHYFNQNGFKVFIVWLNELSKSIQEVANELVKEINDD